MANENYDRETALQSRLNRFLISDLDLPTADYYSHLDLDGFLKLKSVLSDINNILTLRVSLAFSRWVSAALGLEKSAEDKMENQVLTTKPSANGFDIELSDPMKIIAEVKCNIPINRGSVYGSAQKDGIAKDIDSLISGKSKSLTNPKQCLKFMVFLDKPEVRTATGHFIKNMRAHRERIQIVREETKLNSVENVYVVFVSF
jgi:hypothetical protein